MSNAPKEPTFPLVKVGFRDDGGDVETLWAFDLGDHRYQLDSTPWFQYGVSYKDIVEAFPENDGMLLFARVLEKSGYRTVRVQADDGVPKSLTDRLVGVGCSFEGANPGFIAFDIPDGIALETITRILTDAGANWEHADPTYEQLHGNGT
jgi:hypothetical protein